MIAALVAFVAAVAAALFIETRILRHTVGVPITGWLSEHVYIPALRAAAVMAFVVAGYPALYGVADLPPLGEALAARGGFPFLLNLLIVAGLLLPVVPPLHRLPALVLPVQAMIGTGVVFWAAAGDTAVRWFPSLPRAVFIVTLALGAHFVAKHVLFSMASRGRDRALAASDAVIFVFQVPAVWLYARYLGAQLG